MGAHARIGIDLGGTKIAGIVLGSDGKVLAQARVDAPKGNYGKTIDSVCGLVMSLEEKGAIKASIGIGIPGSVSPATGNIQNANSTWLNARPLKQDLETSLNRQVRLANDANCFALSEAMDGAGQGAASVFGVILGTGCGGGLVVNGRIIDGPRSIGGEWGHNPLPWPKADEIPGPKCWCGRNGCMETWVSGPAMSADHERIFGVTLSAHDISQKAGEGCAKANETLKSHASRLARGLAGVINIFDPERVVLGGGLSNMSHLYEQLPGLIEPYIFSDNTTIDILSPLHGAESGVRGAAWLWGMVESKNSGCK
ncbi:MAG: ROK family protein [Gammaproteobacteria bacterium]